MILALSERVPRFLVELSRGVSLELAVLTEALSDPEVNLQEQVRRLAATVRESVSSFVGVQMTVVVDDYPFTVTSLDEGTEPARIGASVAITLGTGRGAPTASGTTRSNVVFYAATPGAFVDLAADAARQDPTPGAVILDVHLDDPDGAHPVSGSTGFSEISIINQALGVIMGGGRTLEQARVALDARAAGTGAGLVTTAGDVVAAAMARHPNRDADGHDADGHDDGHDDGAGNGGGRGDGSAAG
jgi:hypothetical protein